MIEPRVLVVSLFAPYSVNFDPPVSKSSSNATTPPGTHDGINKVHERQMSRSGSTGRNHIWSGRRSSVHRTHTTPLGHSGQPHSRRRSTFSINLAPLSRENGNECVASSDVSGPLPSLATCAEDTKGNKKVPAVTSTATATASNTLCNGKAGTFQLAYNIDEAAGAHTPPPNTLGFTHKQNMDLLREKRERKTGVSKNGRLLRDHRLLPVTAGPSSADVIASPGSAASNANVDSALPADSAKQQEQQKQKQQEILSYSLTGLQINTYQPEAGQGSLSGTTTPGAVTTVPGTSDQFVVEHLNVGNIGLFNAVNASLDLFAERVWIGELGISTDGWSEQRKEAVSNRLLDGFETLPVFVSDKEFEGHYGRFSKQLIWPAFHYIMPEMPQWHGWEKSAYEAS
ncbi:Trehalose-6-P synthase/phosphatase complex subunit, partial [Kickxella alabastrina]